MISIPPGLHTEVVVEQIERLFDADEAVFDPARVYRYALSRELGAGQRVMFTMLNPSRADASVDDPTLARCIGFAQRNGFGSVHVVNLYSARATDPNTLATFTDPVGPHTDAFIAAAAEHADRHILAWGAHNTPATRARGAAVTELIGGVAARRGLGLWCLGTANSGQPRHPLYVPGDNPLLPYPPPSDGFDETGEAS